MSALPLSLAFLLLFHACLALQQISQNQCRIQRLNALEPYGRVQAEAGVTEFFDSDEQQLQCGGVEVVRHRIQPQGLLLPLYLSTPFMFYILQGRGDFGMMVPGCPETYQSSQQAQECGLFQDRHQKIRQFREGDVIVIPAGVAHWMYNNGEDDIVTVAFLDSTNQANQLDQYHRRFFLAGKPQQSQQQEHEEGAGNVFRGFDVQMLAEAFNIDQQTAEKLQSRDDRRGHIVRVERGLQVIRAPTRFEQQEYEGRRQGSPANGYEETICSAKVIHNINEPSRADFFKPGSWLVNSAQ